ncbi:hypothetical protein RF11_05264 [Thelohanellus kitauei]|uniref:DNA-directed RNA polymerase subunit n=1 Tax=Thelohanellus kitauei TaxID=669202 RepID=A0A0C2JVH9_THEKT|nr:hypothetical protein RF11_05264 [Thelohanellus kitauei]
MEKIFCQCGGFLLPNDSNEGPQRSVKCRLCFSVQPLENSYLLKNYCNPPDLNDLVGKSDAWKHVKSAKDTCFSNSAKCPDCKHDQAFYIKQKDHLFKGMSSKIYRCKRCARHWKT